MTTPALCLLASVAGSITLYWNFFLFNFFQPADRVTQNVTCQSGFPAARTRSCLNIDLTLKPDALDVRNNFHCALWSGFDVYHVIWVITIGHIFLIFFVVHFDFFFLLSKVL